MLCLPEHTLQQRSSSINRGAEALSQFSPMGVCQPSRGRACFEGGVVVTSGMCIIGSAITMTTAAVPFYYTILSCMQGTHLHRGQALHSFCCPAMLPARLLSLNQNWTNWTKATKLYCRRLASDAGSSCSQSATCVSRNGYALGQRTLKQLSKPAMSACDVSHDMVCACAHAGLRQHGLGIPEW